jgi:hypothetical protein
VGDIDTAAVDSLKTLDPKRPIREATEQHTPFYVGFVPTTDSCTAANSIVATRLAARHCCYYYVIR